MSTRLWERNLYHPTSSSDQRCATCLRSPMTIRVFDRLPLEAAEPQSANRCKVSLWSLKRSFSGKRCLIIDICQDNPVVAQLGSGEHNL